MISYKRPKTQIFSSLTSNGTIVDHPPSMANIFNNYFTNVGLSLNNAVPPEVLKLPFETFLGPANPNSFFCSPIILTEILDIIAKLKPSKSVVSDCFSSSLIKICCTQIVNPLHYIFNLSFQTGIFPDYLKLSRVTPIFKKGSHADVSNYRPISITNPISKILERLMFNRMVSFVERFQILYDFQFGFRKHYSTSIAVLDLVNMIQKENFEGNYVLGIFLDFQKAFDTIDLEILLKKIGHYGFRGCCLNWFRSYLINRSQFTSINSCNSSTNTINCGIPQGTVLGPLLFLLYINDLPNSVKNSQAKLFADDSNLFVVNNNIKQLYESANCELSSLFHWVSSNKLHINYDKTTYILFDRVKKGPVIDVNDISPLPLLTINKRQINREHCIKYLGVFIDDKLEWTEQINHVSKKFLPLLEYYTGIIVLYRQSVKNIYFALIHSVLTYCVEAYENVSKSKLGPLFVKCNRLLRLLQSKPRRTPLRVLYSTYDIVPLHHLFEFHILKFIHKCLYNTTSTPVIIQNWFQRGFELHNHNTRHKANFILDSTLNPKSLTFLGPTLWSKLPLTLQSN